jgi:putative flavoprotein involved in K+ transport
MHTWGSGRFLGIDRDAQHIAATIIGSHHQSRLQLAVGS